MTLDATLGLHVHELSGDRVAASFEVADRHRQRFGLIHGGTYAAVAEFLASEGTLHGLAADGGLAVGASNHTSFLRPVGDGTVRVAGHPRHRGRTTWLWDIQFEDDRARPCAVARITLAMVDAPDGPPPLLQAPCWTAAVPAPQPR